MLTLLPNFFKIDRCLLMKSEKARLFNSLCYTNFTSMLSGASKSIISSFSIGIIYDSLLILQAVEDLKLNGSLKSNNRKLPNFVNWNWGLIRKFLLWVVVSGLIACLAAIITMVVTIPKACNPDLPWYQGKVFYEIFPASFKDSNNDGTGDLKGLIKKLDYIQELGASAIRLNYMFQAHHYPDKYFNITSLVDIDRSVGLLEDFQNLVEEVHKRNMSIILDIPVNSLANPGTSSNFSHTLLFANGTLDSYDDETSAAIAFWARAQKVDGFYLKNLEKHVEDVNFGRTLQIWKQIIGSGKILIASEEALMKATGDALNILLSRIDLIDIHLDINKGTKALKTRIEEVVSGTLWSKPHYPWVHWNIGSINNERISTKHENNTLALLTLEFVLPGTVSIFYGDEIGLGGISEHKVEGDFYEHKDVHNLVPMSFPDNGLNPGILPWNSNSVLEPKYQFLEVVKNLSKLRLDTPTIYLRATYKEGHISKNMEIRKTEDDLIVIERWYPRRNTCVFVGNLGSTFITTDLSTMFYGGMVVAGTNSTMIGQVLYFDKVTFAPNSALVLKLEK